MEKSRNRHVGTKKYDSLKCIMHNQALLYDKLNRIALYILRVAISAQLLAFAGN